MTTVLLRNTSSDVYSIIIGWWVGYGKYDAHDSSGLFGSLLAENPKLTSRSFVHKERGSSHTIGPPRGYRSTTKYDLVTTVL